MKEIPIVIPAYQPDHRLLALLEELDRAGMGPVWLVDDGSGADCRELFARAGELIRPRGGEILTHPENRGKGAALKTAFTALLERYPEMTGVVTADCDGQHTPACIGKIRQALAQDPEALVLGVRRFRLEGVPWKSRVGNLLTEQFFAALTGVRVRDTQTGLRGIPRPFMARVTELKGDRFELEMEMLLLAAEEGKILEIPIRTLYDSRENHQTHFRPWRDSLKIYRVLWDRFFRFLLSSLSAALLDLALFHLLCGALENRWPSAYPALATLGARCFSLAWNGWVNYTLVFRSRESPPAAAGKYLLLALVQMGASAALVTALVRFWPGGPRVVFKAGVDTALFLVSYRVQQRLVFRKR